MTNSGFRCYGRTLGEVMSTTDKSTPFAPDSGHRFSKLPQ